MKTKILVLGAVVTAFAFTSFAAEPLLTPRQKDNQPKIVTSSVSTQGGTVTYITSDSTALLSPRAKDNQIKVVAGVANDSNPAQDCAKNMNGTPKAISECASHTTMPGCTTVAPLK
ncbi:MAG: hypothetical protein PHY43_10130 [Verrucomicrobiales bacterium]|nr:hypothetical protein [Verrucomicrobiales bacterium]